MSFRNLNNESFGIIFNVASFAWSPISPLIKPRDITKESKQKAIPFQRTFYGLEITNWYIYYSISFLSAICIIFLEANLYLISGEKSWKGKVKGKRQGFGVHQQSHVPTS